ncbi:MAG: HTH-type transcriptional repressor FabR [Pseudomonadota bacterium]
MSVREAQKRQTRRRIMRAALDCLDSDRSIATLSQREVAREAGIASSSFYRHFEDMEALTLALVEEGAHKLQLMMNLGRKRGRDKNHTVVTSVDTFFDFVRNHPSHARLMLREKTGGTQSYRRLIKAAIQGFTDAMAVEIGRIAQRRGEPMVRSDLVADAMVSLLFNSGSEALDVPEGDWGPLREALIVQIRLVMLGAYAYPGAFPGDQQWFEQNR